MRRFISRFLRDDSGATAIEYGLICALVFLVIIGSMRLAGEKAAGVFNAALTALTQAVS